jgi:hypothetical protein
MDECMNKWKQAGAGSQGSPQGRLQRPQQLRDVAVVSKVRQHGHHVCLQQTQWQTRIAINISLLDSERVQIDLQTSCLSVCLSVCLPTYLGALIKGETQALR